VEQVFIGLAHGFLEASSAVDILNKTNEYYHPEDEVCIRWYYPDLDIDWKLEGISLILSDKDQQGIAFKNAKYFL